MSYVESLVVLAVFMQSKYCFFKKKIHTRISTVPLVKLPLDSDTAMAQL